MQELFCRVFPEKHGGFMTFCESADCPDCGSQGVPEDKISK
jgi:hypothetical protein